MNQHIFELSGLGKAPFKVIDYIEKSTGCSYCGRAIKKVSVIKSSDNNIFYVGCECVKKTDDKGLIAQEKVKIKQFKSKVKYEKQMEVCFQIMLEKYGDHPDIDPTKKSSRDEYMAEMKRVQLEIVNSQV